MKRAATAFRRKKAGWNKGTRLKRTSWEMSGASEWTVVDSGLYHECEELITNKALFLKDSLLPAWMAKTLRIKST